MNGNIDRREGSRTPPFLLIKCTIKYFLMIDDTIPAKAAMVGGCLLNVMVTFDKGALLNSVVLTAVGAVVSYVVSRVMKMLFERDRRTVK